MARGKLLPRERVANLLDPGTPFLELAPLAALNMYNNDAPGAGLIAGIGREQGGLHDCVQRRHGEGRHLLPHDGEEAPARAGSGGSKPPALHLPGGLGGANLPNQDDVFPDRDHFGRIFFNQANMSARASRRSRW